MQFEEWLALENMLHYHKSHSYVRHRLANIEHDLSALHFIESRAHIIQQILFNFLYHIFAVICFIVGQSRAPLTGNSVWSAAHYYYWINEKSAIQ